MIIFLWVIEVYVWLSLAATGLLASYLVVCDIQYAITKNEKPRHFEPPFSTPYSLYKNASGWIALIATMPIFNVWFWPGIYLLVKGKLDKSITPIFFLFVAMSAMIMAITYWGENRAILGIW